MGFRLSRETMAGQNGWGRWQDNSYDEFYRCIGHIWIFYDTGISVQFGKISSILIGSFEKPDQLALDESRSLLLHLRWRLTVATAFTLL